MKVYSGNKPCAGCGKPGHEVNRASVDVVCWTCRGLLKLGTKAQQHQEYQTGFVRVSIYRFSNIYIGGSRVFDGVWPVFMELVKAMDVPTAKTETDATHGEFNSDHIRGRVNATIRLKQFNALKALHDQISEAAVALYKAGKANGGNLLIALNNGDITMEQFNEKLK